jgi:hypothetical protein
MNQNPVARPEGDLVVARAQGDHLVHLANPRADASLCGEVVRHRPPQRSFRESGCPECLHAALDAGFMAVLEGDRSWINLRRLHVATV